MKALIAVIAMFGSSAQAYDYYNTTSRKVGNTIYTDTYGPNGYNSNITTRQIGNTTYSDGYDNKGNRVNCTTRTVGQNTYTDCY